MRRKKKSVFLPWASGMLGELLHVCETHAYKEKGDKLAPSLVSMMPLLELAGKRTTTKNQTPSSRCHTAICWEKII